MHNHLISKKKEVYPVREPFRAYLEHYGRVYSEGISYQELQRFHEQVPFYDEHGEDTLWSTVFYHNSEMQEIERKLVMTYAILKTSGDTSSFDHLYIDRIDLCLYGNTLPFRVRIVNRLNDNHDYFYVKNVDANRAYGLELEHILSPSRINYFLSGDTLIEEHIIGIPAEVFMRENMPRNRFDQVRLAKEFVKFNERVFVRLLGDMHSGNFVVDITRDFEKWHFRMRPIDFDQQSHHWKKKVYLPQFFRQNNAIITMGMQHLPPETVTQYQKEERAMIAGRFKVSQRRFEKLMAVMIHDDIAPREHVLRLREQLAEHYDSLDFLECEKMGELVYTSLQTVRDSDKPATPLFQEHELL